MEYKKIGVVLVIAIVVIVSALYLGNSSGNSANIIQNSNQGIQNTKINGNVVQTGTVTNSKGISSGDLAKHNSMNSCWVGYDGKVYDITGFLPGHPGSAGAILPYCGTASEFQSAFEAQHGTRMVSRLMKVGTFMGYFENKGALTG